MESPIGRLQILAKSECRRRLTRLSLASPGGARSFSFKSRGGNTYGRTYGSSTAQEVARRAEEENNERKKKQKVVILGSGWAGYAFARTLDPAKFERIVISPRSHFVFTPLLASTAVGTLEFRAVVEPVRLTGASFHQGWADDIDFAAKTVRVEANVGEDAAASTKVPPPLPPLPPPSPLAPAEIGSGSSIGDGDKKGKKGPVFDVPYDKLVVAVGAYSQTFGIRGVREHAHFLRDVGDARRIRQRVLALFERCATPGLGDAARRELLHFAVVGGGPTGIEFAAELHDLIHEDLSGIYPRLMPFVRITVFDVAPAVLPMFDRELAGYATELFARRGIEVRTQHHLEGIRPAAEGEVGGGLGVLKLSVREHGPQELGVGLVVWSTGLMQNPLVQRLVSKEFRRALRPPESQSPLAAAADAETKTEEEGGRVAEGGGGVSAATTPSSADEPLVRLLSDPKTGGIVTDGHLRAKLVRSEQHGGSSESHDEGENLLLDDVFVIGDCAVVESDRTLPKTAQVASQQAVYLARRLNKSSSSSGKHAVRSEGDKEGEGDGKPFAFRNWGTMAYLGGWRAIHQSRADELKGWAAWVLWRTAYLTKSMSVRNKIMVPFYWFISWLFGRDITRF